MPVGRLIHIAALLCAVLVSASADRATAQVAFMGRSGAFLSPGGFAVGSFGPWSGGYRGFSLGYGSGFYGGGFYGSGIYNTGFYRSGFYSPGFYGSGYYGSGFPAGYYGGGYWPGAYGNYGWGNYGWGGAPYWGGWGGFSLPPLLIPPETLYGPGPVRRLMGLDPPLGTPVVNNTIVNLPSQAQGFGVLAPGQQAPPAAGIRPSNAQARDLAKRQIAGGDTLFAKQQCAQALDAYKQAARAAPDLADSHFRQMVALVALGRYDAAIDAVKGGMRISKDTINGQFKIPALYGDNKIARTAHLDALAKAVTDRPSSDMFFLAGVMLFFDEPQRSGPFFEQAAAMAGDGERWHIDVYREVLKRLPAMVANQPNGNGPNNGNGPIVNRPVNGPVKNGPAVNQPVANGPVANGQAPVFPAAVPAQGPARKGEFRMPPPADPNGGREI